MNNQPQDIVARSIVIVDNDGRPRIQLSADSEIGRCAIVLGDIETGGIQIETHPSSSNIWIHHGKGAKAGVTITAAGLNLRTEDGKLGVVLGRAVTGEDDLIVFRNGQIVWRNGEKQPG